MTDTTRSARSEEIWILGASGRIGSAVTADLAARGLTPVLVGRAADGDRLRRTAADIGSRTVLANGIDDIATEIARQRPAVVFNGIGNYVETAQVIARACMPGGHYLDLAADLTAVPRLLDLDGEAQQAGSTLVTGSGFGVLATEAVVIKLCEDRPTPAAVRVDALASVSLSAGVVGAAFAASMIDMFATGDVGTPTDAWSPHASAPTSRTSPSPTGNRRRPRALPPPNSSPPTGPAVRRPSPRPPAWLRPRAPCEPSPLSSERCCPSGRCAASPSAGCPGPR